MERQLLGTIYQHVLHENVTALVHVLQGAHVVVQGDHGQLYQAFRKIGHVTERISSHASSAPQYALSPNHYLVTLLVGKTIDSSYDTWFQFEGAAWDPFHHPLDSAIHIFNYIEYKIRGVQVGPFGTSKYTEDNPLVIGF